jgi:hypothetical protein
VAYLPSIPTPFRNKKKKKRKKKEEKKRKEKEDIPTNTSAR